MLQRIGSQAAGRVRAGSYRQRFGHRFRWKTADQTGALIVSVIPHDFVLPSPHGTCAGRVVMARYVARCVFPVCKNSSAQVKSALHACRSYPVRDSGHVAWIYERSSATHYVQHRISSEATDERVVDGQLSAGLQVDARIVLRLCWTLSATSRRPQGCVLAFRADSGDLGGI